MLFIKTTFELILAALSMIISVSYCLQLADALSMFLRYSDQDISLGLSVLITGYLIPSIVFLICSYKWINKNFLGVLLCYLITILGVNIISYYLTYKKTSFFVYFILFAIFFLPLIPLVATTTQLISKLISRWMSFINR